MPIPAFGVLTFLVLSSCANGSSTKTAAVCATDAERLVAGRERVYFDHLWDVCTRDPRKPDEATRNFFAATYALPGGMRAGFAQFTAFPQDAKDDKILEQTKLPLPVLAVGGEKSLGALQATAPGTISFARRRHRREVNVNLHGLAATGF